MTPRIHPQVSYYHTYICFLNSSVFLFKIEMPMFSFCKRYASTFHLKEVIYEKNTSLAGREPRRIYPGHLSDRHDSDHGNSGIMQICSRNVSVMVRGTYQISFYLVRIFERQLLQQEMSFYQDRTVCCYFSPQR